MIQVAYNEIYKGNNLLINVVVNKKSDLEQLFGMTPNFIKRWVKKVELNPTLEPNKKYAKYPSGGYIRLSEAIKLINN